MSASAVLALAWTHSGFSPWRLPDGLRLTFDPTTQPLSTIARAVEAERQCCRFLRFGITVESGGGPIIVELSGPPGTRAFVAALLEM